MEINKFVMSAKTKLKYDIHRQPFKRLSAKIQTNERQIDRETEE